MLGFAAAAMLAWACRSEPLRVGDLGGMRGAGELRVIVRPGFLSSPVHGIGRLEQPELLRQLAARLGLRLRWVQARRHDQILPWLAEGRGDIAVSRFSPEGLRAEGFDATTAVAWVEDLVVANPRESMANVNALAGHLVHIHRSDLHGVLPPGALEGAGEPEIVPVPEELSFEQVLQRVRGGRYGVTVCDSGLVDTLYGGLGGLDVVGPLDEKRPLVWGVRADSPELRAGVDQFLFAEQVLLRGTRTVVCRDLTQVRQAGVLRLITHNSPVTCTVARGGLQGFEYDLVRELARRLGVRLDLVIPPPGQDPLRWLEHGYGDILALHEPVPPSVGDRFLTAGPYRRVDLVAVVSHRAALPAAVTDLAGSPMAASASTAALVRLLPLDPPLQPVSMPAGADALTALSMVERGEVELAVAEADTVRLELPLRPSLVRGPLVLPNVALRWVLNPSAPRLAASAQGFLERAARSGLIRTLERAEFEGGRWTPPHAVPVPRGHLTPYDTLLRRVGRRYNIDWRLLAALMYEESRFDPKAVGPGGSAGLFQIMPITQQELGIDNPHSPEAAIAAASAYLRSLMDEFQEPAMADQVAMAIASYNVGPRHVADARRLAREMGLDPDRWAGNVETAMVLLDNPEVARRFPAGVCRCRRAVSYTRRILRRYLAYAEQHPPMEMLPTPRGEMRAADTPTAQP